MMNRSAKGGARSSPHYGGEGVLIHPPYQGVCGWHGREDQGVTPGGLAGFSGGTGISDPISREAESERLAEKYRAAIEGSHPHDEPVGQRWGKVEPALWGRRRSHSPTVTRCLRAARYGRSRRDPRRTRPIPGWHRDQRPYKPCGEVGSDAGRVVRRPNST